MSDIKKLTPLEWLDSEISAKKLVWNQHEDGGFRKYLTMKIAMLTEIKQRLEQQAQPSNSELEDPYRESCKRVEVKPDLVEETTKLFHDTYEHLAPRYGYKTRKASAVRRVDVPDNNKALMRETVRVVIRKLLQEPK